MAGVKGKSGGPRVNSGGARAGAGRKPKAVSTESEKQKPPPSEIPEMDMLTLLKEIALGRVEASTGQIRAAIAAVQYEHVKKGDGGKKEDQVDRAKKAGAGKFSSAEPPKLAAANGKRL